MEEFYSIYINRKKNKYKLNGKDISTASSLQLKFNNGLWIICLEQDGNVHNYKARLTSINLAKKSWYKFRNKIRNFHKTVFKAIFHINNS